MAKVFYHFDDDGRCAAAIVKRELINVFDTVSKEDFIEYGHSGTLELPELKLNEVVYIVDLALDDTIISLIKHCISQGSRVYHIDHHKTGIEKYETVKDEFNANYVPFFNTMVSGCMLTWIFAAMTPEERLHPNDVKFDFADDWSHFALNYDESDISTLREYFIPPAIRYIDDNDVWRHAIPETKYFSLGFKTADDKHPMSKTWDDVIYNNQKTVYDYVNAGNIIWNYQETLYKKAMYNAFDFEFEGKKIRCVNMPIGNATLFGDAYNEYDAVCKYSYNGGAGHWIYIFYSREDGGADVADIVNKLGKEHDGISYGGHEHAAGMHLKKNIFQQ